MTRRYRYVGPAAIRARVAGLETRGEVIQDGEVMAFRGTRRRCMFLLTADDSDSEACHFGNEVLEVADLVGKSAGADLNRLLGKLAVR